MYIILNVCVCNTMRWWVPTCQRLHIGSFSIWSAYALVRRVQIQKTMWWSLLIGYNTHMSVMCQHYISKWNGCVQCVDCNWFEPFVLCIFVSWVCCFSKFYKLEAYESIFSIKNSIRNNFLRLIYVRKKSHTKFKVIIKLKEILITSC